MTFHPTSVDEQCIGEENDVEDQLEQSSKDLKTASKRANVAAHLKVCA